MISNKNKNKKYNMGRIEKLEKITDGRSQLVVIFFYILFVFAMCYLIMSFSISWGESLMMKQKKRIIIRK